MQRGANFILFIERRYPKLVSGGLRPISAAAYARCRADYRHSSKTGDPLTRPDQPFGLSDYIYYRAANPWLRVRGEHENQYGHFVMRILAPSDENGDENVCLLQKLPDDALGDIIVRDDNLADQFSVTWETVLKAKCSVMMPVHALDGNTQLHTLRAKTVVVNIDPRVALQGLGVIAKTRHPTLIFSGVVYPGHVNPPGRPHIKRPISWSDSQLEFAPKGGKGTHALRICPHVILWYWNQCLNGRDGAACGNPKNLSKYLLEHPDLGGKHFVVGKDAVLKMGGVAE